MRARSKVQHNDLQLELFTARLPAHGTFDAVQLPDREQLAGAPSANLFESQHPRPVARKDVGETRSDASPPDVIVLDAAASPRLGVVERADSTANFPGDDVAANIVILPSPVAEPEPLPNQNNYRITEADK